MGERTNGFLANRTTLFFGLPMLILLGLPVLALTLSSSPRAIIDGFSHPSFSAAILLSLWTSATSLAILLFFGTPLAWWLAHAKGPLQQFSERLLDLPVILPPAVVGIALLHAFGSEGVLGRWVWALGLRIPFTSAAVVLAQLVVAAPFYLQAATAAFRSLDSDLILVARTLGVSSRRTFWRVCLPMVQPNLVSGAGLAWARALGEFGATLIFAGNLPGSTQTMPLAIYETLEADVSVATALSLVLAGTGILLLILLRGWLCLKAQRIKPGDGG